ncbi:MAG: hypothetical protein MHPSP_001529, partial [Paramarteilia canceri]
SPTIPQVTSGRIGSNTQFINDLPNYLRSRPIPEVERISEDMLNNCELEHAVESSSDSFNWINRYNELCTTIIEASEYTLNSKEQKKTVLNTIETNLDAENDKKLNNLINSLYLTKL